jgi:hypothetical protein
MEFRTCDLCQRPLPGVRFNYCGLDLCDEDMEKIKPVKQVVVARAERLRETLILFVQEKIKEQRDR